MTWRKSSHSFSNGNCAEVTAWRKSGYSAYNGGCVEAGDWRTSGYTSGDECAEAGTCAHGVAVRDTKDRGGPVLTFSPAAWRAFTRTVRETGA